MNRFLRLGAIALAALGLLFPGASMAHAQYKALVCRGGYEGIVVVEGGSVYQAKASLSNQANSRRIGGELSIGSLAVEQLSGTFSAAGNCSLRGSTNEGPITLNLQWHPFDSGAAVLKGSIDLKSGDRSLQGSIVLFHWFPESGNPVPEINGTYAGFFSGQSDDGTFEMRVGAAGRNKAFMVTLAFAVGGETATFLAWGDVNAAGLFVAAGIAEDGTVILIEGRLAQAAPDTPPCIMAGYLIESGKGKSLGAGSIIAGLIE